MSVCIIILRVGLPLLSANLGSGDIDGTKVCTPSLGLSEMMF